MSVFAVTKQPYHHLRKSRKVPISYPIGGISKKNLNVAILGNLAVAKPNPGYRDNEETNPTI